MLVVARPPRPPVSFPVVDHGVRWGLRNYAGVRGHQHAIYVNLIEVFVHTHFVEWNLLSGGEGRL